MIALADADAADARPKSSCSMKFMSSLSEQPTMFSIASIEAGASS